jgi:ribosome-associated protein
MRHSEYMAVRKTPSRTPRAASSAAARSKAKAAPSPKLRAKTGARGKPAARPKPAAKPKPKARVVAKAKLKAKPAPRRITSAKKGARSKAATKRVAKPVVTRAVKTRAVPAKAPAPAPPAKKQSPERRVAQQIVDAAQETKAERMLLFDLRGESPITDYVLIASGRSQGHVRGIAGKIEERLKKAGRHARVVEGFNEGSWVVLDYDVVIVHVFHPETRIYYDLESLLKSYSRETFAEPEERAADEDAATR